MSSRIESKFFYVTVFLSADQISYAFFIRITMSFINIARFLFCATSFNFGVSPIFAMIICFKNRVMYIKSEMEKLLFFMKLHFFSTSRYSFNSYFEPTRALSTELIQIAHLLRHHCFEVTLLVEVFLEEVVLVEVFRWLVAFEVSHLLEWYWISYREQFNEINENITNKRKQFEVIHDWFERFTFFD